jgi:F0F1-type ATP synthase membrane subunit b/b'
MSGAAARVVSITGLSTLVDTEAKLDRDLANARARADAMRTAARQRAETAAAALDDELELERARAIAAIEAATAREIHDIEQDAGARVARFEAVYGDSLHALARTIADRVIEIALDDAPHGAADAVAIAEPPPAEARP